MRELEKQYDPKNVEDRIYKQWTNKNYFRAEIDPDRKPFTIVIPPPNITGQLHLGHALDVTLQDSLTRYKRMQGFCALWLPGTDHASIATEARIVEALRKEGIEKEALGRDAFLERAWAWKEEYGGKITEQLRKLGASCDWSRERFTMDEGCNLAVREVFVDLYRKGLIYRGERIINWCPHCKTTISDAEVEFEEKDGHLWHIRYPLADGSGAYIEVATTRPETMLGDTAVAVHPDDRRYQNFIGKTLILPLVNKEIPVVADTYCDMEYGTGAVKITPAHDPNDFEVAQRHNLPLVNVLDDLAVVNENGGKYCGMTREDARKAVVADLEAGGYLAEIEDIKHNVGGCYRCDTLIEPRLSKQWFVKMKPLAEPAIEAVENGSIQFVPERFDKVYFNWMRNIRDWCISRQLWWGHRIPVWYCQTCGEMIVSADPPRRCPECGGRELVQDEDTLDTWFSSALWPFSTLGWPEPTDDLDYFYPTDVLVTGYDIIFFWVARMIFSGIEQMEEIPFHTVFIHGIVRDDQGRKMSKSLNNGVDPLEIIAEYGADALRFGLAIGVSPGNDMRFSTEKIKACRNFANKIWNASRFVLMNDITDIAPETLPDELALEDRWLLSKLNDVIREVTDNIDHFELGLAAGKVYDFAWDIFCDWYIEIAKPRLNGEDSVSAKNCKTVLLYTLTTILKLLHPFMPYITEELYGAIPHKAEAIIIAEWPQYSDALNFAQDEEDFSRIMEVIRQIRVMRAERNVPPNKKSRVCIETAMPQVFARGVEFIKRLAGASEVEIAPSFKLDDAVQLVTDSARILIPMQELVDKAQETERLTKELAAVSKEIEALAGRLSNEQFTAKAPEKVVELERARLQTATDRKRIIEQSLENLK